MTTTAQSIIERVQIALHDPEGVRWGAPELVQHLNDAQRAYLTIRPDQKSTTAAVALSAGFRQTLPAAALALVDIPNNATGKMRRITRVDQVTLDAVVPDWRAKTQTTEVTHFMHDLRDPRTFLVYPPVSAGVQVDMTYSVYPTDVPTPGGPAASSVTGNIDLPDHAADPLFNFVMFKAYSKDVEFGGNAALAASFLTLFNNAVGGQLQSTATVAPKS